jgi:hypothetical protein
MATRRSRLKPWPAWAGMEYKTALTAARQLRREARQIREMLHDGNGNEPRLKRLLPVLAQHARDINRAGLSIEHGRLGRPGERWPRWAAQAREELLYTAAPAVRYAENAVETWRRQDQAETERLLNLCLDAGQRLELLLLSGPPPEGISIR